MNLTAVPKLNLSCIDDISASKAGQLENNGEVQEEALEKNKASSQQIRILNAGSARINIPSKQEPVSSSPITLTIQPEDQSKAIDISEVFTSQEPPTKRRRHHAITASVAVKSPVKVVPPNADKYTDVIEYRAKRIPKVSSKHKPPVLTELVESTEEPQFTTESIRMVEPLASPEKPAKEEKPSNKLLALIEVTPEQYEKLSKSLATERNENVESLINFIDKDDDLDPQTADKGENLENAQLISVFINPRDEQLANFRNRSHA